MTLWWMIYKLWSPSETIDHIHSFQALVISFMLYLPELWSYLT